MKELPAGFTIAEPSPEQSLEPSIGSSVLPPGFEISNEVPVERTIPPVEEVEESPKTAPSRDPNEWRNLMADFLTDTTKDLEERKEKLDQIPRVEGLDKLPDFLKTKAVGALGLGQAAGAYFDILGNVLGTGAQAVSLLIPDEIEDPVKEKISQGFNYIVNSEGGKMFRELLDKGMDATKAHREVLMQHPDAGLILDSGLNLAALATPAARFTPIKDVDITDSLGTKIKVASAKKRIDNKRKEALEITLPEETAERSLEMVENTTVGKNILGRQTTNYEPTARELKMAKEAAKAGIKKDELYQESYNKIQKRINFLGDSLISRLNQSDAIIDSEDVTRYIETEALKVRMDNPIIASNAQLERTFEYVIEKAEQVIRAQESTPAGLLKARRELDNLIRNSDVKGLDATGQLNAKRLAARSVRKSMNEFVENATGGDLKVKESLYKQSVLYDALENVKEKAALQEGKFLPRLLQNTVKVLQGKQKINIGVYTLFGITGATAAVSVSSLLPYLAVGGIATAGIVKGYKGFISPKNHQRLGELLKLTNKAINEATKAGATGADMLSQLKADKALLLELLKTPVDPSIQDEDEISELEKSS